MTVASPYHYSPVALLCLGRLFWPFIWQQHAAGPAATDNLNPVRVPTQLPIIRIIKLGKKKNFTSHSIEGRFQKMICMGPSCRRMWMMWSKKCGDIACKLLCKNEWNLWIEEELELRKLLIRNKKDNVIPKSRSCPVALGNPKTEIAVEH